MPNRKRTKHDMDDDWKTCTFCGESVKAVNFESHLERVHLNIDDDDDDDFDEKPRKRSGGSRKKKAELRKELERSRRKKQDMYMFVGLVFVLAVIIGGYYLYTSPGAADEDTIDTLKVGETKVVPGTNEVRIPVSDVDDGKAHFYYFDSDGTRVNYFVMKSSDGVIRAAFDTCDVCYGAKKGYRQEGDNMVCNNCGQRFASTKINILSGGCNPAPLNRSVVGENVVINANDITSGEWYFE